MTCSNVVLLNETVCFSAMFLFYVLSTACTSNQLVDASYANPLKNPVFSMHHLKSLHIIVHYMHIP